MFLLMILSWSLNSARANDSGIEPNTVVQVSPDHSAVTVRISNTSGEDIFCDSVDLHVVRTGADYNDFSSRTENHSGPLYLPKGNSVDVSALGSNPATNPPQSIAAADIDVKLCHAATFSEYCAYAEKTAEEIHTTDLILRQSRRGCDQAEDMIGFSLNLIHQNVRSLKPVGFLKRLGWLDISNNMVKDLMPLKALTSLQVVNLSHNPVDDLGPVLALMSIRSIDARFTQIRSTQDPLIKLRIRPVTIITKQRSNR